MKRINTGIKDCNGKEIYNTHKIRYTYYKHGKVSYTNINTISWGEEDGIEGWIAGGCLLSSIGKDNDERQKETIEIISE